MANMAEGLAARLKFLKFQIETAHKSSYDTERLRELETIIALGDAERNEFIEYGRIEARLRQYNTLTDEISASLELLKEGVKLQNGTLEDAVNLASQTISQTQDYFLERCFNGPYDGNSAIISIQMGEGYRNGLVKKFSDAYAAFASSRGFRVSILDEDDSSLTMKIEGQNAYGHLKGEHGKSKVIFSDDDGVRRTSYVGVVVGPEIEKKPVEINEKDIEIEQFGGSTKGGQHANSANTCIRMTHAPTGISATSRKRSQIQNMQNAREILYSRLFAYQENNTKNHWQERSEPSGGGYKRRFDFTKSKQVSDTSSGYFSNNPEEFFQGKMLDFIHAHYRLNFDHTEFIK